MQTALDTFLVDFFKNQKNRKTGLELEYRPMLEAVMDTCPFGPQVLDVSSPMRHDFEHYCLVWCCAFVCYLVATPCNNETGLAVWLTGLVKSLNLTIPKTVTGALYASNLYLKKIRKYGQEDIVRQSKGAAGWPKKRKREYISTEDCSCRPGREAGRFKMD